MSKTITLKSLELHNFKGTRNQTVKFNSDITEISGKNASGKTTIADAFAWLLWGLNSEDQQTNKFGIKPNDENGNTIPELNPEVEGIIEAVDKETGEIREIRLKRRWVSVFRTKNCEVEKEFVKNKGEYFIDDIPVKESEYKTAVEQILPPHIFKVITNPYYFPKLHWQEKREILMLMAGTITITETASKEKAFEALLDEMKGTTLEAYLKGINAEIARINTELAQIPVRIEEVRHNTPEAPDFKQLQSEKESLTEQLNMLEAMATNRSEAEALINNKAVEIQNQIYKLQMEKTTAIREARIKAQEEAAEFNSARRTLELDLQNAESKLRVERNKQQSALEEYKWLKKEKADDITRMEKEQENLRNLWWKEHNKQYPSIGALICPITKTACQDQQACSRHLNDYEANRSNFEKQREATKEEITNQGKELQARIDRSKETIQQADLEIEKATKALEGMNTSKEIEEIKFKLSVTPAEIQPQEINPEDLPKVKEINEQIEKLNKQREEAKYEPADTDEIRENRKEIGQKIEAINRQLGIKQTIEKNEQRVVELQEAEKKLLQRRADLQKKQVTAERLSKAHMTAVEERVNRLFKSVRFQMFEPTATTGDEKPNCILWVGEAKYEDKNKAGKINAGLDIINTLCRYHGINAPIFIDNAESVNEFTPTDSQLILLKVSNDELKIK